MLIIGSGSVESSEKALTSRFSVPEEAACGCCGSSISISPPSEDEGKDGSVELSSSNEGEGERTLGEKLRRLIEPGVDRTEGVCGVALGMNGFATGDLVGEGDRWGGRVRATETGVYDKDGMEERDDFGETWGSNGCVEFCGLVPLVLLAGGGNVERTGDESGERSGEAESGGEEAGRETDIAFRSRLSSSSTKLAGELVLGRGGGLETEGVSNGERDAAGWLVGRRVEGVVGLGISCLIVEGVECR